MKKENRKQMVKRVLREYGIKQEECYFYTGYNYQQLVDYYYSEKEIAKMLER